MDIQSNNAESWENRMLYADIFDKDFIAEIGAEHFADCKIDAFLAGASEEIEVRVGNRMSEGLSEDKIREFDQILVNDAHENEQWLAAHFPDYQTDNGYLMLRNVGMRGDELINETASLLWLTANRPDYEDIVQECTKEVFREIVESKE